MIMKAHKMYNDTAPIMVMACTLDDAQERNACMNMDNTPMMMMGHMIMAPTSSLHENTEEKYKDKEMGR